MVKENKDLQWLLKQHAPREIALIGMGNQDRGDDAAGIMIADGLRECWPHVYSESERYAETHVMNLKDHHIITTIFFIDVTRNAAFL